MNRNQLIFIFSLLLMVSGLSANTIDIYFDSAPNYIGSQITTLATDGDTIQIYADPLDNAYEPAVITGFNDLVILGVNDPKVAGLQVVDLSSVVLNGIEFIDAVLIEETDTALLPDGGTVFVTDNVFSDTTGVFSVSLKHVLDHMEISNNTINVTESGQTGAAVTISASFDSLIMFRNTLNVSDIETALQLEGINGNYQLLSRLTIVGSPQNGIVVNESNLSNQLRVLLSTIPATLYGLRVADNNYLQRLILSNVTLSGLDGATQGGIVFEDGNNSRTFTVINSEIQNFNIGILLSNETPSANRFSLIRVNGTEFFQCKTGINTGNEPQLDRPVINAQNNNYAGVRTAINNRSEAFLFDAAYSFWGDETGPFDEINEFPSTVLDALLATAGLDQYYSYNISGEGASVNGFVTYCPWLNGPYPEGIETGPCLANADFVGDPVEGLEELCVQFTNLSENASSYLWNFGDGTTSTETNPLHCYSVAVDSFEQYYTVSLAIDGDYGSDDETKIDYIHVGKAPVPEFVFADTVLTDTSICFLFENLSENATSYLWDLGDGTTSTEVSPTNCYPLTGDSISVTLTASNSFADSTVIKKFFAGEAVVADFMAADTVYDKPNVCMRVTFQNLSLNAVEYLWGFGDGETSTDENPTHCFSAEQECYTITLTAISVEGITAVEVKENYICVPQPVVADFTPDTDWGINTLCVNFQNLSLNSKWYWWKFGDGATSAAENPQHCYNSVQKYYTVTLFAANELFMDSVTKTNVITVIKGTSVNYYAFPIAGVPGTTVQFTNHAGGITTKHEWTYGDGDVEFFHHGTMPREKVHPTHEYENEGAYTVKLRSWGQGGEDSLLVKNLVYIDDDYEALTFVDGTPTTNAYPWTNAIDHDVISGDCKVLAYTSYHPEAVFIFADSTEKDLHKVRLMGNNVHQQNWRGHIAKEFEIYASTDGFSFDLAYAGHLSVWDRFEVFDFTPIRAKFVKLVLLNGIGGNPPYLTISEFQTFASEVAPMPKDLAGDGLLITEYALTQNYPNPFNPSTHIRFELPETANVVLKVFNVMGQEVNTLVNQEMNAGRHEVVFDAADVNSGTYFYQISANEFSEVRRMTFIK